MKPITAQMKRHIKLLHGKHSFTYQTFSKTDDAAGKPKHGSMTLDEASLRQLSQLNRDGWDIGVVPNVMDGTGRKLENCKKIKWLFVDCDKGKYKLDDLLSLPVPPRLVVQSSPGHLHPYWRITDCKVNQFESVQTALAEMLGEVNSVKDPSRCMRLAGTINHKHSNCVAKIVHVSERVDPYPLPLDVFLAKMGLQLETKPDRTSLQAIKEALPKISCEERQIWLKVGAAIKSALPTEEGYEIWTAWSKGSSKFDPNDQRKTWNSLKPDGGIGFGTLIHLAKNARKTTFEIRDDRTFAKAIVEAAVGRLRYSSETRTWWSYKDGIWGHSTNEHVALNFVKQLLESKSASIGEENLAKIQTISRMTSAIKLAALDDSLSVDERIFDSNPDLLGVQNGVVNLKTGEFRAARWDDYLTRMANVSFDPSAVCPRFKKFISEISKEREALRSFIRRALAYTLTGHTDEQVLFILLGKTQNGKGVLMNTMADFMGDYATAISPSMIIRAYSGNPNAPTPQLMKLRGARLIVCTELVEGKPMDEAFIKQLTGSDKLTGRGLYGQSDEFKPTGKLWISTNHNPDIAYKADAMWRRIYAIPFDATFAGKKCDPDLANKLKQESSGILNFLLKSTAAYYKKGLAVSKEVDAAKRKLQNESDTVKGWIEDCCKEAESEKVQSSVAYENYKEHCASSKRKPLSPSAFSNAMQHKGFSLKRGRKYNFFNGINIKVSS